jgi:hypothetical protein
MAAIAANWIHAKTRHCRVLRNERDPTPRLGTILAYARRHNIQPRLHRCFWRSHLPPSAHPAHSPPLPQSGWGVPVPRPSWDMCPPWENLRHLRRIQAILPAPSIRHPLPDRPSIWHRSLPLEGHRRIETPVPMAKASGCHALCTLNSKVSWSLE